jgi:phosphoribosylformylglycinamidine cyclo-ligase
MYRVFNMGIGYVIVVRKKDAAEAMRVLQAAGSQPALIGRIEKGRRAVVLEN